MVEGLECANRLLHRKQGWQQFGSGPALFLAVLGYLHFEIGVYFLGVEVNNAIYQTDCNMERVWRRA